ncbi:SDR family oxidoreductase [soil metagenome]
MNARTAVVTGANRGIGLEIARQLAAAGDTVILTARDPIKGQAAVGKLAADGLEVVGQRLDVTEPTSIADLAESLGQRFGRVDVLVNNAAIDYDTWQSATSADLTVVDRALQTNVFGAWRVTQALLPLLRHSGHGRIVNVSSGAGALTDMGAGLPAYRLSKVSLNALTRMLATELAVDRILVNAVCPGWVATDMGGPGGRPVTDGAAGIVWAATLDDDGPSGGFFRDRRPIPW